MKLDDDFDLPMKTLEAPDLVVKWITGAWPGCTKIVVYEQLEGGATDKLNAVRVHGAEFGMAPTDDRDSVLDLLMKIVSVHQEAECRPAKYRFQAHQLKKEGKDQKKLTQTFTIDSGASTGIGSGLTLDKMMLSYLDRQNRHMLNQQAEQRLMQGEIRQTFGQFTRYTETIVGRLIDALTSERAATQAQAQAERETSELTAGKEIELAMIKRQQEFMEMFKPIIGGATEKFGMEAAKNIGNKKAAKAKSKNPLSRTRKRPKDKDEDEKGETDAKDAKDEETLAADLEALSDSDPQLYVARKFIQSLGDEQIEKLQEILGDEGYGKIIAASEKDDNDGCIQALKDAADLFNEENAKKLMAALDPGQTSMVMSLKYAIS